MHRLCTYLIRYLTVLVHGYYTMCMHIVYAWRIDLGIYYEICIYIKANKLYGIYISICQANVYCLIWHVVD